VTGYLGDQKLDFKVPVAHDYKNYRKVSLGKLTIAAAGKKSLTVCGMKAGWHPVNLRAITLTPVK